MYIKLLVFPVALFLVLAVRNIDSAATGLPPSLKACRLNDPELNKCVKSAAQKGIKQFSKGDPERGIPALDPLFAKKANAISGGNLNLALKNIYIHKTGDLKFDKLDVDTKKMFIDARVRGDLRIESKYDMNGRILILPITGKGDLKADITNIKLRLTIQYSLVQKNGTDYVNIEKSQLVATGVDKAKFHLTNLFGGDRILGENTLNVLNESWEEVYKEINPPLLAEMNKVVTKTLKKLFAIATYAELLLPD